jgi:hypothetical protein
VHSRAHSNNHESLEVAGVKFQDGLVTPIRSDVYPGLPGQFSSLTSAGAADIKSSRGTPILLQPKGLEPLEHTTHRPPAAPCLATLA